ncbi:MAG: hypothetical protein M0R74_17485, partial [Dehalococcoidia bacterium]|nr:hypothetical protein [Dehalococcoidia bacterium]
VIAPRVPHYVMWSPGGEQLALVANGEFGLQLETLVPGEPKAHQVLEVGAPIFSSWSREGTTLAAHIGTALTLFRFMSDGVSRVHIEEKASGFRTPAFTADGRQVLYAVPREPGVALMRYGVESGDRDEVASFAGGVALSSLPDGNVAVAVTRQPDSGVFDGLWVLDPEANHDRHLLVRGPFASAAWAPDGDRVALLIPSQLGDGRYSIQVRDRSGHLAAASEPFLPSQDLRMLFGFWDQYALSHHLWSPDGSQLAITGRLPTDGVSSSFSDPAGSYVLLWNPQRHQPLEPLTPGELAFFPPA